MTRTSLRGALTGAAIAAAAFLGAARASAAPMVTVDIASVGGGYDPYTTTAEAVDQGNGTFVLSGVGYSANFSCDWSITINPDPQMTSNFTLKNLAPVTQTFIMTVTLPIGLFGPVTYQGGYYGNTATGTTYTDTSGDGNVTLATVPGNPFYRALVNAVASQDLGNFSVSAPVSGSLPRDSWGVPIPSAPFGPASTNMQIRWQFSLTGGDTVSSQGFFQIETTPAAPEPVGLALLGTGLAVLAGVRRRA